MAETTVWTGQELGNALRARRKQLGILQAKAAGELGFSERLVSEIENGRYTVAYGKILRYAGYLGVDLVLRERGQDG
jgi:transcriptional regulator with XRE-family HTH domain